MPTTTERLEYLRGQIRAECISYGEIAELESLAEHIGRGDVELLEWANVPEDIANIADSIPDDTARMAYLRRAMHGFHYSSDWIATAIVLYFLLRLSDVF